MKWIKSYLKWIKNHKIITVVCAFILVGILAGATDKTDSSIPATSDNQKTISSATKEDEPKKTETTKVLRQVDQIDLRNEIIRKNGDSYTYYFVARNDSSQLYSGEIDIRLVDSKDNFSPYSFGDINGETIDIKPGSIFTLEVKSNQSPDKFAGFEYSLLPKGGDKAEFYGTKKPLSTKIEE